MADGLHTHLYTVAGEHWSMEVVGRAEAERWATEGLEARKAKARLARVRELEAGQMATFTNLTITRTA